MVKVLCFCLCLGCAGFERVRAVCARELNAFCVALAQVRSGLGAGLGGFVMGMLRAERHLAFLMWPRQEQALVIFRTLHASDVAFREVAASTVGSAELGPVPKEELGGPNVLYCTRDPIYCLGQPAPPAQTQTFRGNLSLPESGRTRIVCRFDLGYPNGSGAGSQRAWRGSGRVGMRTLRAERHLACLVWPRQEQHQKQHQSHHPGQLVSDIISA